MGECGVGGECDAVVGVGQGWPGYTFVLSAAAKARWPLLKKYSINLETVQPQQLLKQRAGVLKSGVVNFQATVATLLEEEPSSKSGVSVQQVTGTR